LEGQWHRSFCFSVQQNEPNSQSERYPDQVGCTDFRKALQSTVLYR
jgi:hypothetical protein